MKLNNKFKVIVPSYFMNKYLNIILKYNTEFINYDNIIISTSDNDIETFNTCKNYNINNIVKIQYNKKDFSQFMRGKFQNAAIEYVKEKYSDSIIIMMDSDIILNENYVNIVNNTDIKIDTLYGGFYHNITIEDYENGKTVNNLRDINCNRIHQGMGGGTQIFHVNNFPNRKYIEPAQLSKGNDWIFKRSFYKRKRCTLPIWTYHIRPKHIKMNEINEDL